MSIEVRNIVKTFGKFKALDDVSLLVDTGELVALLGPSGSGKTTLLRIIAGLEIADSGTVIFHGEDVTRTRAQERKVGFVFQHYALFRHMSIFENVAFGLRVMPRNVRPSKSEIREKAMELLRLVQIDWLADKHPNQLSGGQRQRVALARALAVQPKVLLLDEPFGALDAKVRKELRRWLRRLHDELHITSVFITHDQEEALELADRVVVMNEGKIEQVGNPDEVYEHPANLFVYNFLGHVNLFHGRIEDGKAYLGDIAIDLPGAELSDMRNAILGMRPHRLDIDTVQPVKGFFRARITRILSAGPQVKVELMSEWGDRVDVEISQERFRMLQLEKNAEVFVSARETKIFEGKD
jgi:sulfate/thiosulfate transport system ATP-binding protein